MAPSATNRHPAHGPAQSGSVETGQFPESSHKAVNVSQVQLYSPLRYPGGKTWLVPHIQKWLAESEPGTLVEPFAGGGIVTLTAIKNKWAKRAILVELDPEVASFWCAALHHGADLAARVREFSPTVERIRDLERDNSDDIVDRGFRTLVLNRTRRAGILAPGASLIRKGEAGKGLASRWYPETLVARLATIGECADRIEFHEGDGIEIMEGLLDDGAPDARVFVDPPYTAGGKYAGARLYTHSELDHERLFRILASYRPDMLMTYDSSEEIVKLIIHHGFHAVRVKMMSAHHKQRVELVITRDRLFN